MIEITEISTLTIYFILAIGHWLLFSICFAIKSQGDFSFLHVVISAAFGVAWPFVDSCLAIFIACGILYYAIKGVASIKMK